MKTLVENVAQSPAKRPDELPQRDWKILVGTLTRMYNDTSNSAQIDEVETRYSGRRYVRMGEGRWWYRYLL